MIASWRYFEIITNKVELIIELYELPVPQKQGRDKQAIHQLFLHCSVLVTAIELFLLA